MLHAPLNLANDPWSICHALREQGVEADLATVERSPLVSVGDYDLTMPEMTSLRRGLTKLRFCVRALRYYDVLHYSFAHSILEYQLPGAALLDLRAAARLGVPMLMTFHGCEARGIGSGSCSLCSDGCDLLAKRKRIDLVRRHVRRLFVTTPDLLVDVPDAEWVPQAVQAVRELTPAPPKTEGPIIITHAPSHRGRKGTEHVVSACRVLKARGHDVELRLVEGMPRERALEVYREADIAVDQLLIGWYGVFSVEMMALAKPLVCYIDDDYVARSGLRELPIVRADPSTLVDVLDTLVTDRTALPGIGEAGRRYALEYHDPRVISRRYAGVYAEIARDRSLVWPT